MTDFKPELIACLINCLAPTVTQACKDAYNYFKDWIKKTSSSDAEKNLQTIEEFEQQPQFNSTQKSLLELFDSLDSKILLEQFNLLKQNMQNSNVTNKTHTAHNYNQQTVSNNIVYGNIHNVNEINII